MPKSAPFPLPLLVSPLSSHILSRERGMTLTDFGPQFTSLFLFLSFRKQSLHSTHHSWIGWWMVNRTLLPFLFLSLSTDHFESLVLDAERFKSRFSLNFDFFAEVMKLSRWELNPKMTKENVALYQHFQRWLRIAKNGQKEFWSSLCRQDGELELRVEVEWERDGSRGQ